MMPIVCDNVSREILKFYEDRKQQEWDAFFIELAKTYSMKSKDPSTKVGAVFVNDQRVVVSAGWNGFPRGIADTPERLNNRELKYPLTVHAEMNAIYNAARIGVSLEGCTLYVHGLPMCSECTPGVLQVGVHRVVCKWPDPAPEVWREKWAKSVALLDEAGVEWLEWKA